MVMFANAPESSPILPMTAILHAVYTFLYIHNYKSVFHPLLLERLSQKVLIGYGMTGMILTIKRKA